MASHYHTGHYHIGYNMLGYLPESEVYCTSDPESAASVFRENMCFALDALETPELDAESLQHGTWLGIHSDLDIALEVNEKGSVARYVNVGLALPIRHWIVSVDSRYEVCT